MNLPRIGKLAPIFNGKAVLNEKIINVSSSDYTGKYIILLFYPMNFSCLCATELISFNGYLEKFSKLNTIVIACSIESSYAHLKWLSMSEKEGGIHNIQIPLIADKNMEITKKFGVLNEDEGVAARAMFIIDDKGILRQITINDHSVSRSVFETHRLIQMIQHVAKLRECSYSTDFIEVSSSNIQKTRALELLEKNIARDLIE